ncbi:MAG TPA: 30S ribosomal protein S8 [Candidatus Hydrogenedens sp.]|nr:30S ribosomal protein S8 [Candidatus Hydrogenedens sp.]HOK10179.1 30S ribosomal protein S8 [Candidatus Hydrogenedens sp.]HOL20926.1 30S ribosomal protein S8 [Candidatus Hydrogenedens sp.]HPP59727.1 30S ribosomal protein S8 [Candidatus Hydrogenedens sp.]
MSMNDPISDMFTRIRNAIQAGHMSVTIPASRVKIEICRVLKKEGFIGDYQLESEDNKPQLRIQLKYTKDRRSVIQGIRRVSRPSIRSYAGYRSLKPVRSGFGIQIVSTPLGVMTGRDAKKQKVGGEIICEVW